MATRGHLGGISLATPEAMRVLEASGKDIVMIETVGVGQSEVEITDACDTTLVVVNPGWGDAVQAAKAGLMEIADNNILLQYSDQQLPFEAHDGLTVWNAKDVNLKIAGNRIRYDGSGDQLEMDNSSSTSGISLRTLRKGDVSIVGNYIENFFYGIRASDMNETVIWRVFDLETVGVSDQIAWDESVKNEPKKDR